MCWHRHKEPGTELSIVAIKFRKYIQFIRLCKYSESCCQAASHQTVETQPSNPFRISLARRAEKTFPVCQENIFHTAPDYNKCAYKKHFDEPQIVLQSHLLRSRSSIFVASIVRRRYRFDASDFTYFSKQR